METTKWFDRKFDFDLGTDTWGSIYKRLQTGPGALQGLVVSLPSEKLLNKPDGKWSIKEHIGHLSILERIWRVRFHDIVDCRPTLTPADLDNRATTEAGFNNYSLTDLLGEFAMERNQTLAFLDSIDPLDESKTSLHPRLKQPMRVIDLAYFVVEHDDHHMGVIRELGS